MRRNTVCVLLYFISGCIVLGAPIVTAQSSINNPDEQPCVIPFLMEYQLMAIEVTIKGVTGYLCIDTGTDGLVIRDTYFKKGSVSDVFSGSNGGHCAVGHTFATVQFLCHSKDFRNARVMNLDHLMPYQGLPILGLVGWDAFATFELQLDFRNSVIRLGKLGKSRNEIGSTNHFGPPIKTLAFRFKGRIPYIEASIGEETLHLMLDTGASVNVLREPLQKRLASHSSFVRMIKLRSWGKASEVPLSDVSGVMLDDMQLESMKTVWYDMSKLNRDLEGPEMDGVLGQEFMRQYLVTMNFASREVSIYPYENAIVNPLVQQESAKQDD